MLLVVYFEFVVENIGKNGNDMFEEKIYLVM